MKRLVMRLIRGYQLGISPLIGGRAHCKHFPSCSEYGYIAIDRFGVVKGGWLTLKRIGRCGPNGAGGLDVVPELEHNPTEQQRACPRCKTKIR